MRHVCHGLSKEHFVLGCHMSGNGLRKNLKVMVKSWKFILIRVWHFEAWSYNTADLLVVPLNSGRNISCHFDVDHGFTGIEKSNVNLLKTYHCLMNGRPAAISDILYLFGQGNVFIGEKSGNFQTWYLVTMILWVFFFQQQSYHHKPSRKMFTALQA